MLLLVIKKAIGCLVRFVVCHQRSNVVCFCTCLCGYCGIRFFSLLSVDVCDMVCMYHSRPIHTLFSRKTNKTDFFYVYTISNDRISNASRILSTIRRGALFQRNICMAQSYTLVLCESIEC